MLTIYGSMLCPDCIQCCEALKAANVAYDFRDFKDNLLWLKTFLKIRDESDLFQQVRENGSIGIPCIVKADGSVTLSWEEFL